MLIPKSFINIHMQVSENMKTVEAATTKINFNQSRKSGKVEEKCSFVLWHLIHGFPLLLSLTLIRFVISSVSQGVIITVLLPKWKLVGASSTVKGIRTTRNKKPPQKCLPPHRKQFSRCIKTYRKLQNSLLNKLFLLPSNEGENALLLFSLFLL